jgi:hypothetical protein
MLQACLGYLPVKGEFSFGVIRMDHIAPILQAIASLAWAFFAFTALYVLKPEITRALGRLRKGEILGQKFELGDELVKLENSAAAAEKEVQELPRSINVEAETGHFLVRESATASANQEEQFDATIKSILQQATSAPKIALMTLRAELEKRARQALATRGMLRGRPVVSVSEALSELHQYGFPPNLSGSLKLFDDVGNKIIHGAAATDDDALRVLDSGMTILRALNALPNEVNVVYHPGIEIFSDATCTKPISDAKGIILETTSPGGVIKTLRIFPTTRTHFQKGKQVAWEWNMQKVWPAAWYRDLDTGAIKEAWLSSAEFIGRHVDDI